MYTQERLSTAIRTYRSSLLDLKHLLLYYALQQENQVRICIQSDRVQVLNTL